MEANLGADPALVAAAQVTIGPVLIGSILNVLLLGVSLAQFFLYWRTYRSDKLRIKLTMTSLFVLDVFNTVAIMVIIYRMFITHYGSVESVFAAPWLMAANLFAAPLIALIVQIFYAWRVYRLTSRRFIPICLVCLSIIANLSGFAVGVAIIGWVHYYADFARFRVPGIMWLAGTVLCDCGITLSLVRRLKMYKTGVKDTDNALENIIWLTVQTGMLTSTVAVVNLILYLAIEGSYHMILNQTLPGLYIISILSSLNARSRWKFGSDNSSNPEGRSRFPATANSIEFRHDCATDCEAQDGPTEIFVMYPLPQVVSVPTVVSGQRESRAESETADSHLSPAPSRSKRKRADA